MEGSEVVGVNVDGVLEDFRKAFDLGGLERIFTGLGAGASFEHKLGVMDTPEEG